MAAVQTMIATFLIVVAAAYLLARLVLERRLPDRKRLEPEPPDPLAPDLAALVPALPDAKRELQTLLWRAGAYRPSALTEYLAVRAVLVVGVIVLTGLAAVLAEQAQLPLVVGGGLLLTGVAFSLPRVLLGMRASARAGRVVRALPLAMDVVALCLTAGQNLLSSLERASRQLASSCPDLAEELRIVHQQARMHSLEAAVQHWADRLDLPEVRSLTLLLVQSDRLGTDMVNTLLEVSDSSRTLERQKVEAQANRANFWMLFPTLFCLWTASAIVLVGPVYLEFWEYRREQMKNLLGDAMGQVKRSQPLGTASSPSSGTTPTQP